MHPILSTALLRGSTMGALLLPWLAMPLVHADDMEDLAKASQNPVADMISVPMQNNTNFNVGPENKTQNVLNIQPVLPFSIGENWNLVTRTIFPIISQPVPGENRENGMGDILFTAFFSPKQPTKGGWIWGAGPVVQLDTATDDALGSDQWGLGPSAVFLKMAGPWVLGGLVNNIWDIGSSSDEDDINFMTFQPFINYNFPNKPGRYLTFSPIVTANWEADSGNQWTIPLGMGIGQVTTWGKQPVNLQVSAYYNVEKPDFGADWQLRLQVAFLFPK